MYLYFIPYKQNIDYISIVLYEKITLYLATVFSDGLRSTNHLKI